jgi:outer membrane protein OmpA-like peptidoglycan-associated protein/tetratricopeptide (TPR) repeat protein
MKRKIFTLSIIAFFTINLQAQSWKLKKADEAFNRYDYATALSLYKGLKDKTADVYRNMAESYVMLGQLDKAVESYAKVMESGDYKPEDLYRYAYLLRMEGNYDAANQYMKKYAQLKPGDTRVKHFLRNPGYIAELQKMNTGLNIKNVSVNSSYQDFGPVYYDNGKLVFASSRGKKFIGGRIWSGNEQPYLNLYIADITEDNDLANARLFFDKVNKKYHDGPVSFNASYDYMVVTRNIYNEKNLSENKLWLYEANKTGDDWSDPKPLHFNSKEYSCGHAALSQDGNTMYFVSDMPGTYGKTDLYIVRKENGEWGQPRNLGNIVNTEGKEMFPYLTEDGKYLFFASDGLPGLGGLDVFVSEVKEDGSLSEPVNVGSVINTNRDDFALTFKGDGSGFFSSNREGGKGDDDIYSFTGLKDFMQKFRKVNVVVKVENLDKPAKVKLIDENGKVVAEETIRPSGEVTFDKLDPQKNYKVVVESPDFEPLQAGVDKSEFENADTVYKKFKLEPKEPAITEENICSYKLPTTYYDLDKYYLRDNDKKQLDKLVDLMNKYPHVKLLVESHTDSRASKPYNIRLSRNRTMSVVKYLRSKGIPRKRIIAKWYGETRPVNKCVDGVECSEEEHQLNRRTEFKFVCDKK